MGRGEKGALVDRSHDEKNNTGSICIFFLLKYVCILLLHYWKQSNTDIAYFQTTSLLPGFLQFGGEVEENAKGVL